MTGSLSPRPDRETLASEQAAGQASDCWCVAYHFTDLAGLEICEHECHELVDVDRFVQGLALIAMIYEIVKPPVSPTRRGKSWLLARLIERIRRTRV